MARAVRARSESLGRGMTARSEGDEPARADGAPVVMGVTPRPRGLGGQRSRWAVAVAAIVIGCLDVLAIVVALALAG
jgi:hypothetical protein